MRLNDFDMLGEPVTLSYRGRKRYQTKCGAALTILLIVCMVVYAALGLVPLNSS